MQTCSARPGTPWGTCQQQRHGGNEPYANKDSSTAPASFLHSYGRTGDISSCRFLVQHINALNLVRQKHSHKEADDQDGDDADALHVLPECFPLQLDRQLHRQRFLQSQWMTPSDRMMPTNVTIGGAGTSSRSSRAGCWYYNGKAAVVHGSIKAVVSVTYAQHGYMWSVHRTTAAGPTRMDLVRSIGERLSSMDFNFSSSMARNSWSRLKFFLDCSRRGGQRSWIAASFCPAQPRVHVVHQRGRNIKHMQLRCRDDVTACAESR
jgi:hypothetical protein